jgi:hypothetical protein
MTRIHSTLIALVLGAAAAAGLYAAVHTVRLGQKTPASSVSRHDLAARQAKLSAWGRSLEVALRKRPPALPKLPHFAPVAPRQLVAPQTVATAQPPVTYVHAPTVVRYEHAPAPTTTTTATAGTDDEPSDDSSDDTGDSGGDG